VNAFTTRRDDYGVAAPRAPGLTAWPNRGGGELVAYLADSATGPTLTLPASVRDAFMGQWVERNRVAETPTGVRSGPRTA
jgi:hypothetical protein